MVDPFALKNNHILILKLRQINIWYYYINNHDIMNIKLIINLFVPIND
jgi:hypothetical protein